MLENDPSVELDMKLLNKFGQNELGKTKWNKLNGWQRVWLAICIFTLIPTLIFGAFSIDIIGIAPLVVYTIIWALLMALLYIGGLTLRWIIKGFKDEK